MPKKKTQLERFSDLCWNDIEEWAGGKIVARGKDYQCRGHVSGLAVTDDRSLLAWVDGTERYATRVAMDEDGLPSGDLHLPFRIGLQARGGSSARVPGVGPRHRSVPKAKECDERLEFLEDEKWKAGPYDKGVHRA